MSLTVCGVQPTSRKTCAPEGRCPLSVLLCLPGIEEPVVQALASCVSPAHGPLTEDAELVHQEQRPQWVCDSVTSQLTVSLEPDLWLRGFR